MASLQAFPSFLPRAPKFPLPLPLLTPATQAKIKWTCKDLLKQTKNKKTKTKKMESGEDCAWTSCTNAAARLIFGIGKFSHITPALYELHWLPVSLRIDYKILLLTFKCIYGLAPTYLSDLISIKSNSLYNLRSTGKLLLDHPKGKMLTTLGARSFSAAAPKLWNELPVELRQATSLNSFKSRLKTYLFKKYFL